MASERSSPLYFKANAAQAVLVSALLAHIHALAELDVAER